MLDNRIKELESILTPENIRETDTVKANKDAYRKLGKDPNRYRPASESLMRRIANGKGLYFINNVVDILNLISINTGYSICGYDYEKINGDITFGTGEKDEPYEGIGRGSLNIEKLPVFRDETGAFGTPTSDSVRTMVTEGTTEFLMIIIGFGNEDKLRDTLNEAKELYGKYAGGKNIEVKILKQG
jgi:DNA/RNA-binding domain of Phe-tRNA-synthetase-like protein